MTAERAVKLMEDFNGSLTKDNKKSELLLQCIQEHRRLYPNYDQENHFETNEDFEKIVEKYCETDGGHEENDNKEDQLEEQQDENDDKEDQMEKGTKKIFMDL
ncbi:hypothetical protein QTP88_019898 [Uroleucon formosanum]